MKVPCAGWADGRRLSWDNTPLLRSGHPAWSSPVMRRPRILMCPPDFYGIEYEINPWMSRARGSSPERARTQWHRLQETLAGLGVTIELMTPHPGLPDLVFTANAGLVFEKRFFSSRFRHEVRA